MAHPSEAEAAKLGKEDAPEAIELARGGGPMHPVVTIADGADHHAQTTAFHKRWWRAQDEKWPGAVRDAYDEAFTKELHGAKVAVVELEFDAADGKWSNIGAVDLRQWEPMFPFDPESTGWVRQDSRSRVGWRRRSIIRDFFKRKKKGEPSGDEKSLVA
jgi:hypothetical protein